MIQTHAPVPGMLSLMACRTTALDARVACQRAALGNCEQSSSTIISIYVELYGILVY